MPKFIPSINLGRRAVLPPKSSDQLFDKASKYLNKIPDFAEIPEENESDFLSSEEASEVEKDEDIELNDEQ